MSKMTENLIQDVKETKCTKSDSKAIFVGAALLIVGIMLLVIRAFSPNSIDAAGYLHEENFILVPFAFLFLIFGLSTFVLVGVKNIVTALKNKDDSTRKTCMTIFAVCLGVVTIFIALFILLTMSNS